MKVLDFAKRIISHRGLAFLFRVFIGVTFHLILDLIEEISWEGRIDKISLIYDYFKFKKLKLIE